MTKEYKTKEEILHRGQEMVGIPFGQIDKTGRLNNNKGGVGQMIEENWFGYSPNSEANADFEDAGVELKATPYIKGEHGIRAKERLVCNIINYMTEWNKTFETSDFWRKNETTLVMSYQYVKDVPKQEYTVDKVFLFSFPADDLMIIRQDWEKINQKIRDGEAHLLSEGDTLYLGACTKGASAKTVRQQPFSAIPAKQRAYSLKQSYMTSILNKYIFGADTDEHIITDWHTLQTRTFEDIIIDKLKKYYGWTIDNLKTRFGIESQAKNLNELLVSRMLNIKGKVSKTVEFKNAGIELKTIRVQNNGRITEHMSFPTFKFTELIEEDEWEESTLYNQLATKKFLFCIFQEDDNGEFLFRKALFWNIPAQDLEEVFRVWLVTKNVIQEGVEITQVNGRYKNNLPSASDSPVAHVRPHGRNREDTYPLPDGRVLTKQCFWLNNRYIEQQIGIEK